MVSHPTGTRVSECPRQRAGLPHGIAQLRGAAPRHPHRLLHPSPGWAGGVGGARGAVTPRDSPGPGGVTAPSPLRECDRMS